MKLTELSKTELDAITKNLKTNKYCYNCGSDGVKKLSENIVDLMILNDGAVIKAPFGTIPAVMLTCPKCGYISLFNLDFLKQHE